jgi:hypothetical protein
VASPLQAIDSTTLRSWWSPVELEIVKASASAQDARGADRRIAFEPWLIVIALLVFLAELLLVHVLCPAVQPAVTASPIRRRGFVAPLRSRQEAAP